MPSTYAHHRMGLQVIRELNDDEREIVSKNKELFLIGLHGPDILFYYHPLASNAINRIGYETHAKAGSVFFQHAAEEIKEHNGDPAYLAYTYGVICHFALDVTCHGYIDEKIAASGVSHTEIEVEFDRRLMLADGKNPLRHNPATHIVPSEYNAQIIQSFYIGANTGSIKYALEEMIRYNHLLIAPHLPKRLIILALLKISGNYKEMHGLLINYRRNPKCIDSNAKLMQLYQRAEKLAVRLIGEYDNYLFGIQPLDHIYDYTFGSKPAKGGEK